MLKGFSFILFIVIIIAIIIVAILVWPKGEQEVISPTGEQEEEEELSDWKTYRNEKYGFEMKYPKEGWGINESEEAIGEFYTEIVRIFHGGIVDIIIQTISQQQIDILENMGTEIETIDLQGTLALKGSYIQQHKQGPYKLIVVYQQQKNIMINFVIYNYNQEKEKAYSPIFEKFISSFRFLEETMDVQVYFVDKQMMIQGTADYKDMVKPVIRTIPKTEVVARAAIEELLKGLIDNEDDTYSNSIPNGTKMNSLNIENKVAFVDFSEELGNYGGGSAVVSSIEWQIKKTLMQFSTVDNVIISIKGETDNILQP